MSFTLAANLHIQVVQVGVHSATSGQRTGTLSDSLSSTAPRTYTDLHCTSCNTIAAIRDVLARLPNLYPLFVHVDDSTFRIMDPIMTRCSIYFTHTVRLHSDVASKSEMEQNGNARKSVMKSLRQVKKRFLQGCQLRLNGDIFSRIGASD